jgi:hypothetical protein
MPKPDQEIYQIAALSARGYWGCCRLQVRKTGLRSIGERYLMARNVPVFHALQSRRAAATMKFQRNMSVSIKLIAASVAFAAASFGSTATYKVTGTNAQSLPVNAQAVFTVDASGDLTITLTNLQANPTADNQGLNGIIFSLSTITGAGVSTISSSSGALIDITSNSSAPSSGGTQSPLAAWSAATSLQTVTLSETGSTHATETIVGPAAGNGDYTAANSSIVGSNHNDFINQTATFTFNASSALGLSGSSNIASLLSGVQIALGTSAGEDMTMTLVATPEPPTFLAVGIGLLSVGLIGRRGIKVSCCPAESKSSVISGPRGGNTKPAMLFTSNPV